MESGMIDGDGLIEANKHIQEYKV